MMLFCSKPMCANEAGVSRLFFQGGLAFLLSTFSLLSYASDSTVCQVGCDFTSIQTAISDPGTVDGDTITVHAGGYSESINFVGKNINVVAVDGSVNTFLGGDGSGGPVVRFENGESSAILQGFTFNPNAGFSMNLSGIYIANSANPTLIDLTFQSLNAGHPIHIEGGSASVEGSHFTGNYVTPFYVLNSPSLIISNSEISNNYVGAIFATDSAVEIENTVVSGNSNSYYYGVDTVFLGGVGQLSISDSTFNDNSGSIQSVINAPHSTLSSPLNIRNSSFSNNTPQLSVVSIGGSPQAAVIENSSFTNNYAVALYVSGAALDLRTSDVIGNTNGPVHNTGGGIVVESGSDVSISNSRINNNQAEYGGGIALSSSTLSIIGSEVNGNIAHGYYGGGIQSYGELSIADSMISGNYAVGEGGGIYVAGATTTIVNSIIAGNSAGQESWQRGGGIHQYAGDLYVYNSTIAGNYAPTGAGLGIIDGNTYLKNTVAWGNSGEAVQREEYANGSTTAIYSNIEGGYTGSGVSFDGDLDGTGNFAGLPADDPLFVSLVQAGLSSPTTAGDYHIQAGSPMIDAGKSTGLEVPVNDIDGEQRDAMVDLGADELAQAAPAFTVSGLAYESDRTTPVADGTLVRLLVNGVSKGTSVTINGSYSIGTVGNINPGDALLVYLDDSANTGNTATVSDGNNLVNFNIHSDHFTVRNDNYGVISNASLLSASQSYVDDDILYGSGTGPKGMPNFSVAAPLLWLPTGYVYQPEGSIEVFSIEIDGDLQLNSFIKMGVKGHWDSSQSAASSMTNSWVRFEAADGAININPGITSFSSIEFSSGATYELIGDLHSEGSIAFFAGTLNANGHSIRVDNHLSQPGGYINAGYSHVTVGGNVTLDGSVDSTGFNHATLSMLNNGSLRYNNLAANWVNGIGHLISGQNGATTTVSSNGLSIWNLTIGSGMLTGQYIIVMGSGNPFTFDPASRLTVSKLKLWDYQQLPTLQNGYETDIYVSKYSATIDQVGDVSILGNLYIGTIDSGLPADYNTNGFNLDVSGSIVVGAGDDVNKKTLNGVNSLINAGVSIDVAPVGSGTNPAEFLYTPGMVFVNGVPYQD